jgi:hypothetical protein
MYFRSSKGRSGSELSACSERLIRQRVDLCIQLELIESGSGQLTRLGKESLIEEKFDILVARQTRRTLEMKGFSLEPILQRSWSSPKSGWIPNAKELLAHGQAETTLTEFRLLLNLLVECGAIRAIQSRLYFPPG